MKSALLIIDMQMLMQERLDSGRDHVNSHASEKIANLAKAFRTAGRPVLHVRHQESDRASPLHPDAATFGVMPCAEALDGEPVFLKTSSSAFATTALEAYLRQEGISELVVVGAVAGFCVNSTVRAGCDLGFEMTVVEDAVLGFDLPGLSARSIFDVTMGLLAADFAQVLTTEAVITNRL